MDFNPLHFFNIGKRVIPISLLEALRSSFTHQHLSKHNKKFIDVHFYSTIVNKLKK